MRKVTFCVMFVLCCVISTCNVSRVSAQDIWAISASGIDCYVSTDSIRKTGDKSFYVCIKNVSHLQNKEPESIAYFEDEGWSYDAVANMYFIEDMVFFYYDESINAWKSRSLNYTEYTPISSSEYAHAIFDVCVLELQKNAPVLHLAVGELQNLLVGEFLSEFKGFGTDELQISSGDGSLRGTLSIYRIAGFQGKIVIQDSDTAAFLFQSDIGDNCYIKGIMQFFSTKGNIRLTVNESNFAYIHSGDIFYFSRE